MTLSLSSLVSWSGSPPEVSMRNTCGMPPTGETNATAWPSGERHAPHIGLFHWLICVIFPGPLGTFERGQKRYATRPAARSAKQAAKRAYRFHGGCTDA